MNQKNFAELVGVTPQRVSQWIQDGMAGVTWHGGRGKGTFIEVGKAVAWLKDRGYAMNPDSRRDGGEFATLVRDVKEIHDGLKAEEIRAALDRMFGVLDEAAQEIAEALELAPHVAWDAAAIALACAHHHACNTSSITAGLSDEAEEILKAGFAGPSTR